MTTGFPCLDNARMRQILRHAKVRLVATSHDRVVLVNTDDGPDDPMTRLLLHMEPTAARGGEHMPSAEEAIAMGLIEL